MNRVSQQTSHLFCIGNAATMQTYAPMVQAKYRIFPSTAPGIQYDWRSPTRRQNHFLFFAGTGNVGKGLDILLEAFLKRPDITLHIATTIDQEILTAYGSQLYSAPNIILEGFIPIRSARFKKLTSLVSFVVLPSASEGTATSVTTCMRAGLIPLVTEESGIDVSSASQLITSIDPTKLGEMLATHAELPQADRSGLMADAFIRSRDYSQANYTRSIETALMKTLLPEL